MSADNKSLILYFANWNLNKKVPEHGGEVAGLPWDKFSKENIYINHAFWAVAPAEGKAVTSIMRREQGLPAREDFILESMNPENDMTDSKESAVIPGLPRNHFSQYAYFCKKYPNVKILLSIGGWSRCGYFSEMAHTEKGRDSFVKACIDMLKKYDFFGGIDIDWEYPGCSTAGERLADPNADDGDQGCPIWESAEADSKNFTLLLKQLREKMDQEFGKGTMKLTACAGASTTAILPRQTWETFSPYLDYINIMTYDISGVWDGVLGHASSLKDTQKSVEYLKALGIQECKICIGSPLYAIAFQKKSEDTPFVPGSPCETKKATTSEVNETHLNEYSAAAVSDNEKGWHHIFDEECGAAYLYNDDSNSPYSNWFLSYEDTSSLNAKIKYISNSDLAGLIVWETSQDDTDYSFITRMVDSL